MMKMMIKTRKKMTKAMMMILRASFTQYLQRVITLMTKVMMMRMMMMMMMMVLVI